MRCEQRLCLALTLFVISLANAFPARASEAPSELARLMAWLRIPSTEPDLLTVKIAIDHVIDASSDASATRATIAKMAFEFRRSVPADWPIRAQVNALLSYIYEPGPWNEFTPFGCDFANPEPGRSLPNQLLSNYLADRAGNCVSMPVLFAALGQQLGLDMTLALAPAHVLVKVKDETGDWFNIEATGGGYKADSSYQRDTHISERALATGIYLQPLSKRESAAVLLASLMEFYRERPDLVEFVADTALRLHPKFVEAMLHMGSANYRQRQYRFGRNDATNRFSEEERAEFLRLSLANIQWFQRAEDLGWIEPTAEQRNQYLQSLQREKDRHR